jgi:hypothetical protein
MGSQVRISSNRERLLLSEFGKYNQPWFIFILVYLSFCVSFLIQSTHSFVPLKDKPPSPISSHNQLIHSSPPSFASFIASINASIINGNNKNNPSSGANAKKNPNGFKNAHNDKIIYPINDKCSMDATMTKVLCQGLTTTKELPLKKPYFLNVIYAEFVNVSSTNTNTKSATKTSKRYKEEYDISLEDLHELFPNVAHLSINHSPESSLRIISRRRKSSQNPWVMMASMAIVGDISGDSGNANTNKSSKEEETKLEHEPEATKHESTKIVKDDKNELNSRFISSSESGEDFDLELNDEEANGFKYESYELVWESVKYLNLSWNELTSEAIFPSLMHTFPNLELLDISNNFVSEVKIDLKRLPNLRSMDISGKIIHIMNNEYYTIFSTLFSCSLSCEFHLLYHYCTR